MRYFSLSIAMLTCCCATQKVYDKEGRHVDYEYAKDNKLWKAFHKLSTGKDYQTYEEKIAVRDKRLKEYEKQLWSEKDLWLKQYGKSYPNTPYKDIVRDKLRVREHQINKELDIRTQLRSVDDPDSPFRSKKGIVRIDL